MSSLMKNHKELREKIMREALEVVNKRLNENTDYKLREKEIVEKYSLKYISPDGKESPQRIYFEDVLYWEYPNGGRIIDYDDDEYNSSNLIDKYMYYSFFCENGEIRLANAEGQDIRFVKLSPDFKELFLDYISDENNLDFDE